MMRNIRGSKASSGSSADWIDPDDRFVDRVNDVIADHAPTMTNDDDPMEVV